MYQKIGHYILKNKIDPSGAAPDNAKKLKPRRKCFPLQYNETSVLVFLEIQIGSLIFRVARFYETPCI